MQVLDPVFLHLSNGCTVILLLKIGFQRNQRDVEQFVTKPEAVSLGGRDQE